MHIGAEICRTRIHALQGPILDKVIHYATEITPTMCRAHEALSNRNKKAKANLKLHSTPAETFWKGTVVSCTPPNWEHATSTNNNNRNIRGGPRGIEHNVGSISDVDGVKEIGTRKRERGMANGKETRVIENVPEDCYRTQITSLGIDQGRYWWVQISRRGVILLKIAGLKPPVSTKDNPYWQPIVRSLRSYGICSRKKRHHQMGVYEGRRRFRSGLVSAKSHSSSSSRDRLAEALSIGWESAGEWSVSPSSMVSEVSKST